VCDLETSRMGAPYIYDISRLRAKDLHSATYIYVVRRLRVNKLITGDETWCFAYDPETKRRSSEWVGRTSLARRN